MFDHEIFDDACREFLSHLRLAVARAIGRRGHRQPSPEHLEQLLQVDAEARDRRGRSGLSGRQAQAPA